jgi:3'-phosphoadenosine 5'-phosphosulfate sulfotransferase (PAPS reductase)/FAD synthetase
MLGRKQWETQDRFLAAERTCTNTIARQHIDNLIDRTIEEMKPVLHGKRYGLAWSGGKDSVAVELCLRLGFPACPSAMGKTHDLEYPAFMAFVTNNMPEDFVVYNNGKDLKWLSQNLQYLFPKDAKTAMYWFKNTQHRAYALFTKAKRLDYVITGRRKLDTNNCGTNGLLSNRKGVTTYSPIRNWTHEEVLACMKHYNLPRAPFYDWPNGFVVGSGSWPARQWTGSEHQGWAQVYAIDPSVVQSAAKLIPNAEKYMQHVRNLGI